MQNNNSSFINFKNVTVLRDTTPILNNISLSISTNENVAIIGPNGSGKSTLMKLITAQIYPSYTENSTVCKIFNKKRWDVFELRHQLGIVTNDLQYSFHQNITAFETVLSGFFSSIGVFKNHQITTEMEEKSKDIINFLEVSSLAKRKMDTLSSGEARRFIIARALINNPKVLILDEPSNSLDIYTSIKLNKIIRKIISAGVKIILVTHLASDIVKEIDRFILLKNGKIFADGSRVSTFNSETLSDLFEINVYLKESNEVCWLSGKF